MSNVMDWFERIVVYILVSLMMVIIILAIIGFVILIAQDVTQQPYSILNVSQILDILGYVLLILIGSTRGTLKVSVITLSFSIGIAYCAPPYDNHSIDKLLRQADQLMYEQKKRGCGQGPGKTPDNAAE